MSTGVSKHKDMSEMSECVNRVYETFYLPLNNKRKT